MILVVFDWPQNSNWTCNAHRDFVKYISEGNINIIFAVDRYNCAQSEIPVTKLNIYQIVGVCPSTLIFRFSNREGNQIWTEPFPKKRFFLILYRPAARGGRKNPLTRMFQVPRLGCLYTEFYRPDDFAYPQFLLASVFLVTGFVDFRR